MKMSRMAGVIVGMMVLLVSVVPAQDAGPAEDDAAQPLQEIRRIVLRRYTTLPAATVWKAADAGQRADVRFSDTFTSAGNPLPAMRRVRMGRKIYRIAAVFGTEGDLACLVPANQRDTLAAVGDFARGQEITVEGTIIGRMGTRKAVLVDRVLTGLEEKSDIEHELIFTWPRVRRQKPKLLVEPGEYRVEFPCRYVKDEVETFTVLVSQEPRERFLAEMARRRAIAEAEKRAEGNGPPKKRPEAAAKQYATFRSEAVYRLAADGNVRPVRFVDRVKGGTPSIPRSLFISRDTRVRVGYAFDTYTGLTCVIRARETAMIDVAARLLPGQEIRVDGVILPPGSAYKVVLVDKLDVPGLKGHVESPDVWVVRLLWGEETPKMFYEVGGYGWNLPCAHAKGRRERLGAELREMRVIKGRRVGAPAPTEEPEQPKEDE